MDKKSCSLCNNVSDSYHVVLNTLSESSYDILCTECYNKGEEIEKFASKDSLKSFIEKPIKFSFSDYFFLIATRTITERIGDIEHTDKEQVRIPLITLTVSIALGVGASIGLILFITSKLG